jgi:hypothetical protein
MSLLLLLGASTPPTPPSPPPTPTTVPVTQGAPLPRLRVAWATSHLHYAPAWQTVTGLQSVDTDAGRNGEFDSHREGTCKLRVNNLHRHLEPGYSGSTYYPNVTVNKRVRVDARPTGRVNLLDAETASFRHTPGTWSSLVNASSLFETDTALEVTDEQAATGDTSLKITSNGVATAALYGHIATTGGLGGVAVTAGVYQVTASVRAATTGRTWVLAIRTWDASGAFVLTHAYPAGAANTSAAWQVLDATVTFGSTEKFASISIYTFDAMAAGEVHYLDRVALVAGSTLTYDDGYEVIFDGLIDSISPAYDPTQPRWSVVDIDCTDLTKVLARTRLRSPYRAAVDASAPLHWWRQGEAAGQQIMADSGSSPAPGVYTTAREAADRFIPGSDNASTRFDEAVAGKATIPQIAAPWSVAVAFTDYETTGSATVLAWTGNYAGRTVTGSIRFTLNSEGGIYASASSFDISEMPLFENLSVGTLTQTVDSFLDGKDKPQHVVVTWSGSDFRLYVNGAFVDSDTSGIYSHKIDTIAIGGLTGFASSASVTEATAYDRALTADEIAALAAAAREPWNGDDAGTRVERIVTQSLGDADGVAHRVLAETGATTLGTQVDPLDGTQAIDAARTAEQTEFGRLFVTPDGYVAFYGRHHGLGDDPAVTFTDVAGSTLPYAAYDETLTEDALVNVATATRQGGIPQTWTGDTTDGEFGWDRTGAWSTDGEALGAAQWVIFRRGTPLLRVSDLTIKCHRSSTLFAQVLALGIGDRIAVRHQPTGGGAANTTTLVIEGVKHQVVAGSRTWTTTLDVSNDGTGTYFALDTAGKGLDIAGVALAY